MKKILFVLSVFAAFIGVPVSILFAGMASALFIGAGSGMFVAYFTGHAPISGPFTFTEFLGVSIFLALLTYFYAKYAMKALDRFARWADEVKLN
ncbi:hypothetical protein KC850_00445 [Candidatus Kaiserbacteria bacterium]|nr:hypothetical protein [Candidatus Kaiserbacteria bacterium]